MTWSFLTGLGQLPQCVACLRTGLGSHVCLRFSIFRTGLTKFIFWGFKLPQLISRSFVAFLRHFNLLDSYFPVTKTLELTIHGLEAATLRRISDHCFIFRVKYTFVSTTKTHFTVWSCTQILHCPQMAWLCMLFIVWIFYLFNIKIIYYILFCFQFKSM